jgi:hypothetical protein
MRRRHDEIVAGFGKKAIEERAPLADDEAPVGSLAELASRLAARVAVHDDHRPEVDLRAGFGLRELRRVEGAVAAAADDDDVPQRMSLPPSTTRTVPVT